jgi:nicotinamidase/pyrazinamidase
MDTAPQRSDGAVSAVEVERGRDALLIIDLQPDFMPGGALAVADGDAVVAPIVALLGQRYFDTVVATQDWHPAGHMSFASRYGRSPYSTLAIYGAQQTLWPDHCVAESAGAALDARLPQSLLSLILRKGAYADADSYSAFRENIGPDGKRRTTGLGGLLKARGIGRVFLGGLARDYCVAWSALDAATEGFEVVVLEDLCRAVFPERAADTDVALAAAGVRCLASTQLRSQKLAEVAPGGR